MTKCDKFFGLFLKRAYSPRRISIKLLVGSPCHRISVYAMMRTCVTCNVIQVSKMPSASSKSKQEAFYVCRYSDIGVTIANDHLHIPYPH